MTRYAVLGGGIAGVCCALELARCVKQENESEERTGGAGVASSVVLISASPVIKGVREVARLGRLLEELEVVETSLPELAAGSDGALRAVHGAAEGLDLQRQVVKLAGGGEIAFDKLCICTGARPKELGVPGANHPAVMTLRDTDSVQELALRLRSCRRLVLVGNGGIALELAGALAGKELIGSHATGAVCPTNANSANSTCSRAADTAAGSPAGASAAGGGRELVWVLKHGHIGDAFFDLDAAAFLLQHIAPAAAASLGTTGATGGSGVAVDAVDVSSPAAPQMAVADEALLPPAANLAGRSPGYEAGLQARDRYRHMGHAAGPAWTRELLRGLRREQQDAGQGQAGQSPVLVYEPKATGEAGAACSSGRGAGGASGNSSASAALETGPASDPESFHLRLEFSSTVTRIAHHARPAEPAQASALHPHAPATAGPAGEDAERNSSGSASTSAEPWPLHVTLSTGKVLGADLVVVGIGVDPHTAWLPPELARGPDGGLVVGADMRTSHPAVWAAGDCCSCEHWCTASADDGGGAQLAGPHWFQHRLWTQARVMGTYAARCMAGLSDELASGFNFELFTHVTRFLGFKVVLLGLYNGQRLEQEPAEDTRLYSREGEAEDGGGPSFVRLLLLRGRLQGAVLIGETGLEEALENLILDGLDLSSFGPAILDPGFELEHVFD
ncbi:hypothetical protein CHLRE_03g182550v5 [Chlamydomonas reinhardtii]|uniref:FAD/NAD(P)-binding domain-containing protein n=1 Tax=Chlamydomonas reinhardtii TaxID=3055 RepID=A0A2K3DXV8_CHLRE|nr:uncharacterized protein CHLRE_03g182550v5 [Chlamydomonas reinhardtii]PNW85355.1 hypothetical protein CHLRE_03g182550v5 [Chlamydomonas reinhardtii]